MSSVAFQIFSGLVRSLQFNHENGQLTWAQIVEDMSRPDNGITYVVLLGHYDGTQTEHRFVFFDGTEESGEAYSLVRSTPYFKEWNYEDYID